jgi:hypothetical protein
VATNALEIIGPVPRGRPSSYSEAIAREICERLAQGETLVTICADDWMPHEATIYRWRNTNADFSREYARAREAQMDLEADQIRVIADDLALLPEHKRVMVDARKWRAERLNRGQYGAKVEHEIHAHSHAALGAERVPEGLEWLVGQLPSGEAASGPGPDHSDVGEE